ncbi:HpcH/HpaI aldolase/citrate lyase family protein [Polynucleobacter rarus]|uniref:HpcH/HpaI aldolase/citrate lyase family protein n=1 Tax=Polynucleobacter rarus TaxID=556055 RepID=UPI000D3E7C40|nr:CoA ester lyase [Polynucleobacter rarus]
MNQNTLNPWPIKSLLFVPANREDFVLKAIRFKPQAVILDLEDAVPRQELEQARLQVKKLMKILYDDNIICFVRINSLQEGGIEDLNFIVCEYLSGIMVPKIESAEDTLLLDKLLLELEINAHLPSHSIDIIALPETALGIFKGFEIANASPRVKSLMTAVSGPTGGDVAKAIGYEATPEGLEQLYLQSKVVLESKAANAPYPIAGVIGMNIKDLDYVKILIQRAKNIGFTGVALIHPSHVEIANQVFSLSGEEINYHKALVQTFLEANQKGLGATTFQGSMIDQAMYQRSLEILQTIQS